MLKKINKMIESYKFTEFEIYYHNDLDGVTSAIMIKKYIEENTNLKLHKTYVMSIMESEFIIKKPDPTKFSILVDFSRYKKGINLFIDHHDTNKTGLNSDECISIIDGSKASNVSVINEYLCKDINTFNTDELVGIDIVDGAQFCEYGIYPEQLNGYVYDKDKYLQAILLSKMINAYKHEDDLLNALVESSNTSFDNIYETLNYIIEFTEATPVNIMNDNTRDYVDSYKKSKKHYVLNDSIVVQDGTVANCYNKGSYNRYGSFINYPDSNFVCTYWDFSQLISLSYNPFKHNNINPKYNLIEEVLDKIISSYKDRFIELDQTISLYDVKKLLEQNIDSPKGYKENSIGFTYNDLKIYLPDTYKDIQKTFGNRFEQCENLLIKLLDKTYTKLEQSEIEFLDSIKSNVYELVKNLSGGHKTIINIDLRFVNDKDIIQDIFDECIEILESKYL